MNGQKVSNSASLLNLIAELTPGIDAQLMVARKQQTLDLTVQAGRRPAQRTQAPEAEPVLN